MSNLIGLINYGLAGNTRSIQKALEKAGANIIIVNTAEELDRADKLVIPGVGSYAGAIERLSSMGLLNPIKSAITKKPTLGICLGMQILTQKGFEFGETNGLGFFEGHVRPILCDNKVPHMGFNQISVRHDIPLLKGLDGAEFYFMHSYNVINYRNIAALTSYGDVEFVSAIAKDHVFGVQFHPEKSREVGIELFKNFVLL